MDEQMFFSKQIPLEPDIQGYRKTFWWFFRRLYLLYTIRNQRFLYVRPYQAINSPTRQINKINELFGTKSIHTCIEIPEEMILNTL